MPRRLPSLNGLRAFEAAARLISFTGAAAELNVSHAAISRHIRELEGRLGVKLFIRTGRGVALTKTGRAFGEKLTPIFDALVAATNKLSQRQSTPTLAVSTEAAIAARWLVPRLGRFAHLQPEIELNLDPDDRVIDFRRTEFDLAIRYGRGGWQDVDAILLTKLQVFPVCSPDFLKRYPLAALSDLARAPLLHQDNRQIWQDWLMAAGVDAAALVLTGTMFQGHIAIGAAEAGQGVALADDVTAADALLEGQLVRPFDCLLPVGGYFLVTPKGAGRAPPVKQFCDWLKREMAASHAAVAPRLGRQG